MPHLYFFDLDNGLETIPDEDGVLADSESVAVGDALSIIAEMRAMGGIEAGSDWNLVIRDADGSLVKRLSIK